MTQILEQAGLENAEREADWLIEAASGRAAEAIRLAQRRASGEPLQYLTGVAGFRRLELAVGPGVLVPRPETEVVAGRAMELLPREGTLVDVGTGSGAIALAVADERPDARVLATESSIDALCWAERNRAALSARMELVAGDLFGGLPAALRGTVDVVVSNPPYIAEWEREALPRDVVEHEPHVALFAGDDGLAVIRRLARASREWLRPGGWLVVEIDPRQASAVRGDLESLGYEDVATGIDLAGRLRVAEGRRST